MLEFNIKLRNDAKKLNLSKLKSDSLKFKFKVKGLYKDNKFKGEVYLLIKFVNHKFKIIDISIYDFNIFECKSSYDDNFYNIYTNTAIDLINNHNLTKKVYKYLKTFIYNVKIISDKNLITNIVFNSRNYKIRKLNIKGYIRKY